MTCPDKEIGSFFAYPEIPDTSRSNPDVPEAWQLVNSGRAALKVAIRQCTAGRGGDSGQTVWLPTYYCEDVVDYLSATSEVRRYPCNPTQPGWPADAVSGDVVVVVSYFGRRPDPLPSNGGATVILDATHDPFATWIGSYECDYVVGSLRKTCPVPEGGFLMRHGASEMGHLALDSPDLAEIASATAAMIHKRNWLNLPQDSDKSWYEELQRHEEKIGELPPSLMSQSAVELLSSFPLQAWRQRRIDNLDMLKDALGDRADFRKLPSTFGLVLEFRSAETCSQVRAMAIAQRIYPARLWPLSDDAPEGDRSLSGRLLMFHTDYRYGSPEMSRTASAILSAL